MREQKNRLNSIFKRMLMMIAWITFSMLFIVCIPSSSIATIAKKATLQSLVEQAQLIVHIKVEDMWSPKHRGSQGEIYTYSRLRLIEVWNGTLESPEIILVQLGGSIDDLKLKVHGDAELKVGDEVILFLSSSPKDQLPVPTAKAIGTHQVVHLISLAQGAFFVDRTTSQPDPYVRQKLDDLVFYTEQNTHLNLKYKAVEQDPTPVWTLSSLRTMINGLSGAKP